MIYNLFRKPHLDEEKLTGFIDGTCSDDDRVRIVGHLKSCARCSEAYREAVLYKGLWTSGASDLETSEESVAFAGEVFDRNIAPARSLSFSAKYLRMISIAASVVIIAAFGISHFSTNRESIPALDENHIVRVREAAELASMNSRLVIPGGERSIDKTSEVYRSGYIRINDSLRTALAYFTGIYYANRSSRDAVYWLLGGHIATGQVNAARDLASQAIKEFPDDIDMMVFDAIISYMEGDTTSAEQTFRQVLEIEPGNPYANLNLAVLLSEGGDRANALDLLGRVIREHGDSPFAARAIRITEEIRESRGTDF